MADIFDFHVYDDRSIRYELAEPIMLEDKDVTQFRFRIPKSINGFDMTSWEWWFIFVNPNGTKYTTLLELTDDEDEPDEYSIATYTVGYGFSGIVGTVKFSIEALNVSGEEIVNEWHTKTYATVVTDTLQGFRAVIIEPDGTIRDTIIEEIQAELDSIDSRVDALENGSVGIENIEKTSTSGIVDTYTIYLTDGTSYTFTVTNGEVDDAEVRAYIEDWLNTHPDATTTVLDGSITEAKLNSELKKKVNTGSINIDGNHYKFTELGQLYTAPSNYVAWGQGAKYDRNIHKFVHFLYCAPKHIHSTATWQRVLIDPVTLEADTPTRVTFYESDGETVITFEDEASGNSWRMMNDVAGHYQLLKARKISGATYKYKYNSYDYGLTWIESNAVTMPTSGLDSIDFKLSNGRLLTSYGGPILYSDDDGDTWSQVTPATAGGDYEAECAFIELSDSGKVMAIARYSKSGGAYYNDGRPDPAIISYSQDYGTTWSQWAISKTITDMNAIGCTAIKHDGFVELFVSSRWYDGITNYTNTGKRGCVYHYVASIENALDDNFTMLGIVHYAKGSSAQDLMAGELSLDENGEGLLCVPDSADGTADTCAKWYYKATRSTFFSLIDDDKLDRYRVYSNQKVNTLLKNLKQQVNELQLAMSNIPDSGVNPPDVQPDEILWTKTWDASSGKLITETMEDYIGARCGATATATTDSFDNAVNTLKSNTSLHYPVSKQNYAIEVTQSLVETGDNFYWLGFTFYDGETLKYAGIRNYDNKLAIINAAGNTVIKQFCTLTYPCFITRRIVYRGELNKVEITIVLNGETLFDSYDANVLLTEGRAMSDIKISTPKNTAYNNLEDISDLCVFCSNGGYSNNNGVISVKFGEWGTDLTEES